MDKRDKKGIELPGWVGRFESYAASEVLPSGVAGVSARQTVELLGAGFYVIYRRLPEVEPMPPLLFYDAVSWEAFAGRKYGVVTSVKTDGVVVRDKTGKQLSILSEEITSVSRDGNMIWERKGQ